MSLQRRRSRSDRGRASESNWLGTAALIVAAIVTVTFIYLATQREDDATTRAQNAAKSAPNQADESPTEPAPGARTLPSSGNLVAIGDSWTYGIAAEPITKGYAYDVAETLGLTPKVYGYGSVGYVNPGGDGNGNFLKRFLAAQPPADAALVIIQGTQNDLEYRDIAVKDYAVELIEKVKDMYPEALIVMVGPAPARSNLVSPMKYEQDALKDATRVTGIPFISPIDDSWLGSSRWGPDWVTVENPHLTNKGHAYFADRVVAALRALPADD